jgi:hypothetical protein
VSTPKPTADPTVRNRQTSWGGGTVTDLADWCHQRGLSPDEVTVTGGHLKWTSPETDEERARRQQFEADRDARLDAWERGEYERLRAKFEATR